MAEFFVGIDEAGRAARKRASLAPQYIVGIDEAGRGPLAGPLAVGAVMVSRARRHAAARSLNGIRDSKKLTEKTRTQWLEQLEQLERDGVISIAVVHVSPNTIDTKGIVSATQRAIADALKKLEAPHESTHIKLDGGLRAPAHYTSQETIIRGDESEPLISAASIAAKVTRDRIMVRAAERYNTYGFERHKGYGTKEHQNAIAEYGLCPLHRRTFCTHLTG